MKQYKNLKKVDNGFSIILIVNGIDRNLFFSKSNPVQTVSEARDLAIFLHLSENKDKYEIERKNIFISSVNKLLIEKNINNGLYLLNGTIYLKNKIQDLSFMMNEEGLRVAENRPCLIANTYNKDGQQLHSFLESLDTVDVVMGIVELQSRIVTNHWGKKQIFSFPNSENKISYKPL